jgi:hypothetical protein
MIWVLNFHFVLSQLTATCYNKQLLALFQCLLSLHKSLHKNQPTLPNEANGCRQPHVQPADSACASG